VSGFPFDHRQYNGKKGNQTPNTNNDRQYNGKKGNQTPNTKNDREYNGQNGSQTPFDHCIVYHSLY
jgi:hypothetical protein